MRLILTANYGMAWHVSSMWTSYCVIVIEISHDILYLFGNYMFNVCEFNSGGAPCAFYVAEGKGFISKYNGTCEANCSCSFEGKLNFWHQHGKFEFCCAIYNQMLCGQSPK